MKKWAMTTMVLALAGCVGEASDEELLLDDEVELESSVEALEEPTPDNPNPNVPHPVSAPSNLRIVERAHDHVTIGYSCQRGSLWMDMLRQDPGTSAFHTVLTRSTFNTCGNSISDMSTLPESRYCYRLRLRWSETGQVTSGSICATTPKPTQAPDAPTLSVESTATNSVVMRYVDQSSFETWFKVYRKRSGTNDWTLIKTQLRYDGNQAGTTGSPVHAHRPHGATLTVTDSGLDADTPYVYRVDAGYDPLDGSATMVSSSAEFSVRTEQYRPETPTGLRVDSIDGRDVSLSWNDAEYASSYELSYDGTRPHYTHQEGTKNAGASTSYTFLAFSEYTYCFKVRAKNRSGTSTWSTPVCDVYVEGEPPPQPTGFSELAVYNCADSHDTLSLWLFNRTTGQFEQQGSLASQWQGSGCPGTNAPFRISLSDDTVYDFVAVDPGLLGCGSDDPGRSACQRLLTQGIRGDSDGKTLPITVP